MKLTENKVNDVVNEDNIFGLLTATHFDKCINGDGYPTSAKDGCQVIS